MENNNDIILKVENLKTYFKIDDECLRAVDGVTFSLKRGKTVAIVGESGCGKSVTAYSILRLIQKPGRIVGGKILLYPRDSQPIDIVGLDYKSDELFDIRGGVISMVFQEPMTALSPVHTIGNQICEAILLHQNVTKAKARELTIDMLGWVGIPAAAERISQYPHEMSGGMRQRAVIAMALVCRPQLLIADEPTTALDVTIQAQIIALMKKLQQQMNTSILLITHDLGVVAQMADEAAVMYLGRIVEQAPIRSILNKPRHPYTKALLKSLPSLSKRHGQLASIKGSVPPLSEIPPGCPFHTRCLYYSKGLCDIGSPPELREIVKNHKVACLRTKEIQET